MKPLCAAAMSGMFSYANLVKSSSKRFYSTVLLLLNISDRLLYFCLVTLNCFTFLNMSWLFDISFSWSFVWCHDYVFILPFIGLMLLFSWLFPFVNSACALAFAALVWLLVLTVLLFLHSWILNTCTKSDPFFIMVFLAAQHHLAQLRECSFDCFTVVSSSFSIFCKAWNLLPRPIFR